MYTFKIEQCQELHHYAENILIIFLKFKYNFWVYISTSYIL